MQKFVDLRKGEGFLAELYPLKEGCNSWYLNAFHCSIKSIVEEHPMLCDQELNLIREVFSDCHVDRVQWTLDGCESCGFKITTIE